MPPQARLIGLAVCAIAILFIAYGALDEAMTEKLDRETIDKVYAQGNSLITNTPALKEFMQKRLYDSYQRTGFNITAMKDKPDQTVPITLTKAQTIEMTTHAFAIMTIAKRDYKIVEVQYSQDKRYAYVSSTDSMSGTINVVMPDNKKAVLPFNSGASCIDTLTQDKKLLAIVRSQCTTKTAFLE